MGIWFYIFLFVVIGLGISDSLYHDEMQDYSDDDDDDF